MVGELLRKEREKQNLSIADVEKETSISQKYLVALEKGEYESLPGDVYTKGFIRNYSKFLGINGDELLAQFASERGLSVPQQNAEPVKAEEKHEVNKTESIGMKVKPGMGSTKESSKAFSSGDDFKSMNESSFNAKNIIMGLAGVVVVFLASIYVIFSEDTTAPAEAPKQEAVQEVQKKEETKPAPAPLATEVKVKVKLLDKCWMQVVVDGKIAYEGTADGGLEMNWTGKDKIVINAGNAGAVDLYWNDKSVGLMGKIGEVVDRTLTKDSDGGKAQPAAAPASTPQPQQTSNAKASYTQEAPAPRYEEPAPAPAPQPEPAAPAVQPAPAEAVAPAAAPQANGVEIPKAQ